MKYYNTIKLKDGRICILRNCTAEDGKAVLDVFNLTHEQTDWMLTYPGEMTFTVEQEAKFLQDRTDSSDEIEILAEVDGKAAGTAGISCVGRKEKLKHRAELGVGIDKPENIQLYRRLGFNKKVKDCHYDPCGMDEKNQPEYEEEAWWLLAKDL